MANMPFSDACRRVTIRLKLIGDRVFVRMQTIIAFWEQHMLVHADPFWIATSKQRSSRRRTDGTWNVEACVLSPFCRELINIRSLDRLGTKTPEITIALIISKNNDEVRLIGNAYFDERT